MNDSAWRNVIDMPAPGRSAKPRSDGFTMVLDKGLGAGAVGDLMQTAAHAIDFLKLSFGTSALYTQGVLREKIDLAKAAGVEVYPGGTLLEVAVWQDRYGDFLQRARELGFTAVEVSDGTVTMSAEVRSDCVRRALDAGFTVLTEVGKKSPEEKIAFTEMHEQIGRDLELGASMVILEAREGGKGVGVFDDQGAIDESAVEAIVQGVKQPSRLMWEAPLKSQQQYFILEFGNHVNLGNIPTTDVLALEALRQGLRGDTLKQALGR